MSHFNSEKALVDSLTGYAAVVQRPNTTVSNPPEEVWLALHNMRAGGEPVTVGDAGEDNFEGIMQVDINTLLNGGTGEALNLADVITREFPAGRALSHDGTVVKVRGTSLSPGRIVGAFYRLSLSIRYYVRMQRNA